MITLTREEAQQVLDALEKPKSHQTIWLIKQLRARLSAPEPEPVAYGVLDNDGQIDWTVEYPFSNEPGWPDSVPLYTAPPQYKVPEGYALIGIDKLKTWGVYEQVSKACNYLLKEKNI